MTPKFAFKDYLVNIQLVRVNVNLVSFSLIKNTLAQLIFGVDHEHFLGNHEKYNSFYLGNSAI
jgi:hypothetical protein